MGGAAGLFEGEFHQTAWVTNDFDGAIALFAREYGVPAWLEMRNMPIIVGPGRAAQANIALARRGGVELELIQPLGGEDQVYRQVLTDAPGLQIVFHHICYRLTTDEAFDRARGAADAHGRKVVLEGAMPGGTRFFYIDDRKMLGHHVEYVYYRPETFEGMKKAVPTT